MKRKKNTLTIAIIAIIILIAILIIYKLTNHTTTINGLQSITYEEITQKQKNKEDFILIISQSTCSHCASYKPKVQQIAEDYNMVVYYIDIDTLSNNDEFLKEFNLNGATPVTLFFLEGKETSVLQRIEGDLSTKIIKEKFKKMGFID